MNAKPYSRKLRTDYLSKVVNQLIDIRLEKRLSLEALNYKLGVSDNLVAKWESGHRTPNTFNLYCWAKALDAEMIIVANDNKLTDPDPISCFQHANNNTLKMVS
tara:strand:+ start:111992 stop:112303 length:312 start_codon:yes stop_codon:yes gene_type:complete